MQIKKQGNEISHLIPLKMKKNLNLYDNKMNPPTICSGLLATCVLCLPCQEGLC